MCKLVGKRQKLLFTLNFARNSGTTNLDNCFPHTKARNSGGFIVLCRKMIPECYLFRGKFPSRKASPSVFEQTDLNLHQNNYCNEFLGRHKFRKKYISFLVGHRRMDYFGFIFNIIDGHTWSTDSVDRPCPESKLSFLREYFKVNCCVCFLKMSPRYVDYLFKTLNFLYFFLPRLGENLASMHF